MCQEIASQRRKVAEPGVKAKEGQGVNRENREK